MPTCHHRLNCFSNSCSSSSFFNNIKNSDLTSQAQQFEQFLLVIVIFLQYQKCRPGITGSTVWAIPARHQFFYKIENADLASQAQLFEHFLLVIVIFKKYQKCRPGITGSTVWEIPARRRHIFKISMPTWHNRLNCLSNSCSSSSYFTISKMPTWHHRVNYLSNSCSSSSFFTI